MNADILNDLAARVEAQSIDPKAEYEAFRVWAAANLRGPVPSVYSNLFYAWMASARVHAAIAKENEGG